MTVLTDILFTDSQNQKYREIAQLYYDYWKDPINVQKYLEVPITTCKLCSFQNIDSIAALGLYYDSMPFHTFTMLDAAVVSIMSLFDAYSDESSGNEILSYVANINPDIIRNHFFLNLCSLTEKSVTDWDVIEILKSMMFNFKSDTICLRQYANLTKLLKQECIGTCNTFVLKYFKDAIQKQGRDEVASKFFMSDKNKYLISKQQSKDNTSQRFTILFDMIYNIKITD
jgi:hypothetical protein